MENQTTTSIATDAWTMYIYSVKSQCPSRNTQSDWLNFFAFAGLPQDISLEGQAKVFVAKATLAAGDPNWAFNTILKFVMLQLERVNRKEIVIATLRGYLKSIKLFLMLQR